MLCPLGAQTFVPGHEPLCGPEAIDETLAYLRFVQEAARAGRAAGLSPLEAARATDLGESADLLDPERIAGNLHRAYLETPQLLAAAQSPHQSGDGMRGHKEQECAERLHAASGPDRGIENKQQAPPEPVPAGLAGGGFYRAGAAHGGQGGVSDRIVETIIGVTVALILSLLFRRPRRAAQSRWDPP